MYGSVSKHAFVAAARSFVPELTVADVVPAPAGVRAQASTGTALWWTTSASAGSARS